MPFRETPKPRFSQHVSSEMILGAAQASHFPATEMIGKSCFSQINFADRIVLAFSVFPWGPFRTKNPPTSQQMVSTKIVHTSGACLETN